MRPPIYDAPEICQMSAGDLVTCFATGTLSPVDVVKLALDRAKIAQEQHNAFALIDAEGALRAAEASEARWSAGAPLSQIDGVPGTIKDIVAVKGLPTSFGSNLVERVASEDDAPSVARLRAAGMVNLGLTTTPEFGWKAITDSPRWGVTTNPWNSDLTPGGSSGGAAVAAALGAGVLHLGSDGGGSIRIPSAFTGISGLKPTFGRVPAFPASAFGTVSHIGPMARRVEDVEQMLAVMSGRDLQDWSQGEGELLGLLPSVESPKGKKIAVWRVPPGGTVAPVIAAHFDHVVSRLEAAGALLEDITLPMADQLYDIATLLWFSGALARLSSFGELRTLDTHALDPGLVAIAEAAETFSAKDYIAASSLRAEFGSHMDQLLTRFDYVISPACTVLPFKAGCEVPPDGKQTRWFEWAGFSYPINLSQQPAAVVPSGLTAEGLPQSLQIIAGRGADSSVLAFAKWWQAQDDIHLF